MWPDERVARFVTEHFLPARVHVKQNAEDFKRYSERYKAPWTPTILLLDEKGEEQDRLEGFLPADDFLAQLMLGWARMAFKQQQFADAARRYREIAEQLPDSEAAAEALYYAGAAQYKATGDPSFLKQTGEAFKQRYRNTPWAKKASVWS